MKPEWLGERITIEEAEAKYAVRHKKLGSEPVPFGFQNHCWMDLKRQMIDGDELRVFQSPPASWSNLCGRAGISLVRNGEIVISIVTLMN